MLEKQKDHILVNALQLVCSIVGSPDNGKNNRYLDILVIGIMIPSVIISGTSAVDWPLTTVSIYLCAVHQTSIFTPYLSII